MADSKQARGHSWKQYASIAQGDVGNYWQRDDGAFEIRQKAGGKYELGHIGRRSTHWIGAYPTLQEAIDHGG